MDSFGTNFGRLVREKRGIEDLSQDALVQKTGLTKARISDLENGKIANPHAKTVDALRVALNISREEHLACHKAAVPHLPSLVLENLARRFGLENPEALEGDFEKFLQEKAKEFREMKERLAAIGETNQAISALVADAQAALERGEMDEADKLLEAAEFVQLTAKTIPAIEQQARLGSERGKAALFTGDITAAVDHFERSAQYYSPFNQELEADARWKYVGELRAYAYRYRDAAALIKAQEALNKNLGLWTEAGRPNDWAKAKNAAGAICTRLAQFDRPEAKYQHLVEGKKHFDQICANSNPALNVEYRAFAAVNLATILQERSMAASDTNFMDNVVAALKLQISALAVLTREIEPVQWGILQHNLACCYIKLASLRHEKAAAVRDLKNSIEHADLSFEVREGPSELQYWIASARTKSEALINLSESLGDGSAIVRNQALELLAQALSKISEEDHPNQWGELQIQFSRIKLPRQSVEGQ